MILSLTKSYLLVLFLTVLSLSTALAQKSGVIKYDISINQWSSLPPQLQMYKSQISEYYSYKIRLYFTEDESLYKYSLEDRDPSSNKYGTLQVPAEQVYINRKTERTVAKKELAGKIYILDDSLKITPWKLGTEKKLILGYLCKMAYYTDSTNRDKPLNITAWYTDQLPFFQGPDRYNTLPGTVLAVDINSGERTYVARNVDLRELTAEETIEAPSGTKKSIETTYEGYLKIEADYRKKANSRSVLYFY